MNKKTKLYIDTFKQSLSYGDPPQINECMEKSVYLLSESVETRVINTAQQKAC